MRLVDVDCANLGSQDHLVIIRNVVTGRTQAIAVENRTHHISITEYNGGRAIPRLHHGCVVAVEIPDLLGHEPVMLPRSRNQDHHGHRKLHAAHDHELQRVIQHCGVRTFLADDRQNLVHVGLEKLGLHVFFTGHHLVYVAADGIDLTVMYDDTVRMGAHPARVCVGAEAGMHGCDGGLVIRVLQILKELTQLLYQKHTLVYNGTATHGYDIRIVVALLKYTTCHIQTAVKVQSFFHLCRLSDKALHNVRHLFHGLVTNLLRMGRKGSPAKELQSFLLDDNLQHLLCLISGKLILGEEEHADTVLPGLAKLNAQRLCHFLKEFVGDLQHDADTVSGLSLRVLTCAVFQIFYNVKGLLHGAVARNTLDIGYGTDTAVVMLKARIIKTRSFCLVIQCVWGFC